MKQRNEQPEYALQKAIAQYVRAQYPNAIFFSDLKGNLTMPQAIREKAVQCDNFSMPDFCIFGSQCLFLELKAETPYLKNGPLKKKKVTRKDGTSYDHYEEQAKSLARLVNYGHRAFFCWDFDQAKGLIDSHFYN